MTTANTACDTHSVYSYDSGSMLEGAPTVELVSESENEGSTGAVYAYYDRDAAVWYYCAPSDVERMTRLGETVRTVYVMPDAD